MNIHLHHDICKIGDGSWMNSQIEDLHSKVQEHIPEVLRYSCRYFAQHFRESLSGDQCELVLDGLHMFMTQNFLYWVEVMNLLNELDITENNMCITSEFLKVSLLELLSLLSHFGSRP